MGFKDPSYLDRKGAATDARKAALEKFREKTNDPAAVERQAARQALAAAREAREAERKAAKAAREAELVQETARAHEAAQQAAREAAAQAERAAAERAEREAAEEVERKAARDARYAARKKRKK